MRLCDFCWGGFANVEFAKFASWKCSTWPSDLRLHPEKKKGNIPIPSILWYIYPTFTIKNSQMQVNIPYMDGRGLFHQKSQAPKIQVPSSL